MNKNFKYKLLRVLILFLFSVNVWGQNVPIHLLKIEDSTEVGQFIAVMPDTDFGDTVFKYVPLKYLSDTVLILGGDTLLTSGNYSGFNIGSGAVDWGDLTNIPAGFADGVDDNTNDNLGNHIATQDVEMFFNDMIFGVTGGLGLTFKSDGLSAIPPNQVKAIIGTLDSGINGSVAGDIYISPRSNVPGSTWFYNQGNLSMKIGWDNKVGIGVNIPSEKLDVNGSIRQRTQNNYPTSNKFAVFGGTNNEVIGFRTLSPFSGSWNDLANIPLGFLDNIDNVEDGDTSSINELQNWSNLPGIPVNIDLDNTDDFSGDWGDLTNIPAGFADGIDDNTNDNLGNHIATQDIEMFFSDVIFGVTGGLGLTFKSEGLSAIPPNQVKAIIGTLDSGINGSVAGDLYISPRSNVPGSTWFYNQGNLSMKIGWDNKVGIGNAVPKEKLDVTGNVRLTEKLMLGTSLNNVFLNSPSTGAFSVRTNNVERLNIDATGRANFTNRIGINYSPTISSRLHILQGTDNTALSVAMSGNKALGAYFIEGTLYYMKAKTTTTDRAIELGHLGTTENNSVPTVVNFNLETKNEIKQKIDNSNDYYGNVLGSTGHDLIERQNAAFVHCDHLTQTSIHIELEASLNSTVQENFIEISGLWGGFAIDAIYRVTFTNTTVTITKLTGTEPPSFTFSGYVSSNSKPAFELGISGGNLEDTIFPIHIKRGITQNGIAEDCPGVSQIVFNTGVNI